MEEGGIADLLRSSVRQGTDKKEFLLPCVRYIPCDAKWTYRQEFSSVNVLED